MERQPSGTEGLTTANRWSIRNRHIVIASTVGFALAFGLAKPEQVIMASISGAIFGLIVGFIALPFSLVSRDQLGWRLPGLLVFALLLTGVVKCRSELDRRYPGDDDPAPYDEPLYRGG